MPPAPSLFSTTTGTPQALPRPSAMKRAVLSVPEPVPVGTMKRMARDGYCCCAHANCTGAHASAASATKKRREIMMAMLLSLGLNERPPPLSPTSMASNDALGMQGIHFVLGDLQQLAVDLFVRRSELLC